MISALATVALGLRECTPPPYEDVHFDREVSPFLKVSGGGAAHVYVWAEVNAELAGWFLLDTGSPYNSLSMAAAKTLDLDLWKDGRVGGVGASVKAYGARAETLRVGPLTLDSPTFKIADVESPALATSLGTLGAPIYHDSVIVHDHAAPSVAIYDPATYAEPLVEWEECILLDDKPFAAMQVEGQDVLLEIDTGGGQAVLLCTPAAKGLGVNKGRPIRPGLIYGPFGTAPVSVVTLSSFSVGALRYETLTGTLGVKNNGWLGSRDHDGLIGAPILRKLVVIFDYSRSRISFTDRRLFGLLENGVEPSEPDGFFPKQATGEPDAVDRTTYSNAWFPADNSGKHWLELTYAAPIEPVRMEVWGTIEQRGLSALHAIAQDGSQIALAWSGKVERTLSDGLAMTAAAIEIAEPVTTIRLDIDCSLVDGTNVIDAVGLVDAAGTIHWAPTARANGSLNNIQAPDFAAHKALEKYAARLQARGREKAADSVRSRLAELKK